MLRYIITLALTSVSTAAMAAPPKVVTDIPPVFGLVSMVMGDLGQPDLLVEPGSDGHDFQLRPSQAATLAAADLLVWVGPEMTPWLDRAASGLAENATQLRLLEQAGTFQLGYAEAEAGGHDHNDHDGHDHSGTDPHAWLDPDNAVVWVNAIAQALAAKDPENSATYLANAQTAATTIATVDAALASQLAALKDRPFMVYHDAYHYFARHYGLALTGSIALGDATTPGAGHLSELRETGIAKSVVCIFPEANHDAALIGPIVEGTSIKIGKPLDPEGASLAISPTVWQDILENLSASLQDCLS